MTSLEIILYRSLAVWYWTVRDVSDHDDFQHGHSGDYNIATAEAMHAHDEMLTNRNRSIV